MLEVSSRNRHSTATSDKGDAKLHQLILGSIEQLEKSLFWMEYVVRGWKLPLSVVGAAVSAIAMT
jgi:hypothetical protein